MTHTVPSSRKCTACMCREVCTCDEVPPRCCMMHVYTYRTHMCTICTYDVHEVGLGAAVVRFKKEISFLCDQCDAGPSIARISHLVTRFLCDRLGGSSILRSLLRSLSSLAWQVVASCGGAFMPCGPESSRPPRKVKEVEVWQGCCIP